MKAKGSAASALWAACAVFVSTAGWTADEFRIVIKDHRFEPAELVVPAHTKFKVLVENLDPSAEEFESHDLNREKIISGHGKATLFLGPLKPGDYKYFGEFNPKTAQGLITAKE